MLTVRWTALAAAVLTGLAWIVAFKQTLGPATRGADPWQVLFFASMYAFAAIPPVFYFALYRDPVPAPVAPWLRPLAAVAAVLLPALTAAQGVLQLTTSRPLGAWARWFVFLSLLSSVPVALLLACFARARASEETPVAEPRRALSIATAAALITGGVWVAYFTVALAATFALHWREMPLSAIADTALPATGQICIHVAPFIVRLQMRRARQPQSPAVA